MGSTCSSESSTDPSTDIFVDKVIKYFMVPVVAVLSLIAIIMLYLVEKVDCYTNVHWSIDVDEFCWNNFTDSETKATLPHKLFPILTLCEAMSMTLPLVIWYWCFGKDLKNQILAVVERSNTMTEYYRMYDKGMRRSVSEATLHRELDNLLELLLYLFTSNMPKVYTLYTLKWVVVILLCHAWIIGHVFLLYPDFVIFKESFFCSSVDSGNVISASCSIPTSTFLRAVWYINIAFLALIIICTFACLIAIGSKVKYTNTFFYTSIPGVMDSRLSDTIQETFNPRHFSLLSRFCEDNAHLCTNAGLSRSLSRKYGVPDGSTPGKETIMDKYFPVLQPEQLKKFRLSCENFRTKKNNEAKNKNKSKVRFTNRRDDFDTRSIISETNSFGSRINIRPGHSKMKRNKVENFDLERDYYLTPRLMARKMGKDLKTIKNSPRLSSLNSSQRTPRSLSSVEIGHMSQRSSTPRQLDVYNRQRDIKYVDVHPQTTGHYPVFASRTRELNPYAYRLHNLIMQANAKNSSAWKP